MTIPKEEFVLDFEDVSLEQAVYLAVGAASACWENLEGAGVFESDNAKLVAEQLLNRINQTMQPKTNLEGFDLVPVCQYCLADPRHTRLGPDQATRCPVCGSDYSGPRRSVEYRILVEAGVVTKDD